MVFKPFSQEQGIENRHLRSGIRCKNLSEIRMKVVKTGPILKQMLFRQSTTADVLKKDMLRNLS